ncbi:MAG: hypothetical protein COV36_04725 [Alphaproteobacteria bacterium CG11_big_fil_rev_8_21_14_0_20_44_7]|nr:MAG: hypothetical protein COV36_04725 [Alphaproteobacteria bacterium CG11_big_fil_rev_8_21_14_0_20_44_7]
MSKDSELHDFIKRAVREKISYAKIEKALIDAGWEKAQVENALSLYHDAGIPVAVPKPLQIAAPRLWTLNIFYFAAFYTTLCTLTFAIFTILDNNLPDGHNQMAGAFKSSSSHESLKSYLSIIIVSLPLTIYAAHLIRKAMKATGQTMPIIRLRLIYLSLLIGAIILSVCGILFVNYGIDGDLSLRFGIKVALLLAKFAALYYYFKPELYKSEQ